MTSPAPMTGRREQFESDQRSRGETYLYRRDAPGSTRLGEYCAFHVQQAWLSWQAGERAALEAAAKVCDDLADGWNLTAQGASDGRYDFMAEAGDRCADEIRSLIKDQTS